MTRPAEPAADGAGTARPVQRFLPTLFRTTAFKLTAVYLVIFALFAGLLLGYVAWNAKRLLDDQIRSTIDAEIQGLAEQQRQGGENESGRRVILLAQRTDQREPVKTRQHAVDHQDVITAALGHGVAFQTVTGMVGDMAGLAEGLGQIGRSLGIIFDDQQSHRPSLSQNDEKRQAGGYASGLPR